MTERIADFLCYAAYCERTYGTCLTSVVQYRDWLDRVIILVTDLLDQSGPSSEIAHLREVIVECGAIRDLTHSTPYEIPNHLLGRDSRGILHQIERWVTSQRDKIVSNQEGQHSVAA